MKNLILPQLRVILTSILLFNTSYWTFAQIKFVEPTIKLSKENDAEVKKHIKIYKTFEFDVKELKKLLREKKGLESPSEFIINLNGEKTKFTVFENDILDDNFVEYQDGKIVKTKGEISTYAGYVNDHPKNILRLYVTDNRFSGFFETEQGTFNIGHLADCGIFEKPKNSNKAQIYIAKTDDIYSNLGMGICGIKSSVRNKRTAACTSENQLHCKYIKLAIEVDDEFKANFTKPQINSYVPTSATFGDAVIDMVNRADAPFLNDLGISLKLITIGGAYPSGNDPYIGVGSNNNTITGTPSVFGEFKSSSFVANSTADVVHLLTGRDLGGDAGAGYIYGQAQDGGGSLCNSFSDTRKPVSISTIKCSGNCVQTTNNSHPTFIKYSDAYLTMAHEIAHVLGADHTFSGIMKGGEGKVSAFEQVNKNQILDYYCNKTCVNTNTITSAYTNRLSLKLNGNSINSTPVFINNNTKVVVIPPDNNGYIPLVSSNFSYSNSSVFVFYKTLNNTSFALGSVNSFTLNVSAYDGCLNYYWGVPFVYSAAGARVATAYPNPSNNELTIESSEETPFNANEVEQVRVFEESTQEKVVDFKFLDSKIQINTVNLKNGLKYLKIYLNNGEVITKRILVSHE
jgi:Metallo-peptidase family M12